MVERKTDTPENKRFWDMIEEAAKEVDQWPMVMRKSHVLKAESLGTQPNYTPLERWFWDRIVSSEYTKILDEIKRLRKKLMGENK